MKAWCSLVILFAGLTWLTLQSNCIIGQINSDKWQTFETFEKKALQKGELWTKHARTRLECVTLCNADYRCKATFYHKTSRKCMGAMKTNIKSNNTLHDEGVRFYYKGRPCFGDYQLQIGKKCYMHFHVPKTPDQAVSICKDNEGYLVKVSDEDELNSLVQYYLIGFGFWINGKRENGTYRYNDGQPMTYFKWCDHNRTEDEPVKIKDCIRLAMDNMTRTNCLFSLPFICESD